jgi:hypothetical protein
MRHGALALAGANHTTPAHPVGIVSAAELAQLDLRGTALVVLSACETGVGTATQGEEFAGLRRAFAIAGAQSQVTSLWWGGEAIRARFSAPEVAYDRNGKPAGLWGLNGSASRRDRTLTLTVVNPGPDTPRETEIAIAGARIASCVTRTLTASTLDAHNSFADPDAVPAPPTVAHAVPAGGLVLTFPRASVTAVTIARACAPRVPQSSRWWPLAMAPAALPQTVDHVQHTSRS